MTGANDAALPRWHAGTVASGGEEIYYEVTEPQTPAATILLTHGAGGSHAIWYQQVVAFAQTCRVITWDTRGFGNSTYRSAAHGPYAATDDMLAVLDATRAENVHLVGQSMGGWWVTTFALAHPERVTSIALTNTVAGLWTDALDAHFKEYVANAAAEASTNAGTHPAIGAGHATDDLAHAFLYQQLNTFHSPPMGDVFPALVKTRHRHDDVRALGVPMLVVTGSEDPIFPAPLVREIATRIGAEFVEVAGAGHSPYWERPDEFNAAYLAFLTNASR
jgi:3-oxoadipate enol-lactonase